MDLASSLTTDLGSNPRQYNDEFVSLPQDDEDDLLDYIVRDAFENDSFLLQDDAICANYTFDPLAGILSPQRTKEEQDSMADVLLSLKHAIVHQGQNGSCIMDQNSGNYTNGTGNLQSHSCNASENFSYSFYPQTPPSPGYCNVPNSHIVSPPPQQSCANSMSQYGEDYFNGPTNQCQLQQNSSQNNLFHAMSLNVSMNMTMGMAQQMPDRQPEQWPTQGSTASISSNLQSYNIQNCYPHYAPSRALTSNCTAQKGYTIMAEIRASEDSNSIFSVNQADQDEDFKSHTLVSPRQTEDRLRSHVTQIQDLSKVNFCKVCGKTYARPSTLKTHLRTHSGEKPYECRTCHKAFSQAANLTAHLRTHSGEKPFKCPICERRFSQSSSVTTHMRTHSGERPYQCRLCNKAFSDSSTLTKHMRIHSGEKPYQCTLCLLRFSQSGNLNRHMRIHAM